MQPDVRELFLCFIGEMGQAFKVYNKWHRFEKSAGWIYGFCRNYRCELLFVSIGDNCFKVLGVEVLDGQTLSLALEKAKEAYDSGYEERYEKLVAKKKAAQMQRTQIRVASEKEQMEKLKAGIDTGKLNSFRWAPKVSRKKLAELYRGEAKGLYWMKSCLTTSAMRSTAAAFRRRKFASRWRRGGLLATIAGKY